MNEPESQATSFDRQMAVRLKSLRTERQWSLDLLAERSGVSRASLSRLENADVSPTAHVLGKLCAAYGLTLSRLMHLVEDDFTPLVRRDDQPVWTDPETGFLRRSVSPPAGPLNAEGLECVLKANTSITYEHPPRRGLEHHLLLVEGLLTVEIDGTRHRIQPGDCLRYQLHGRSAFTTPSHSSARYFLFVV
ncbi:MAG: XRE family transcriptional regulator [Alphaproteobacteria bacterium]|nr:XRE family transcriptional regulator [Alphaproteobacteria bacterium]